MLRWAILFAILALVAGVLGFGGLAGDFASIAKILLFVFLVLFVVSLVLGRGRGGPVLERRVGLDRLPESKPVARAACGGSPTQRTRW
jgi:uncharacterized membrane protein YtjA (UPF0391 family)